MEHRPTKPFPADSPRSLTDGAAIAANDWQAFRGVTQLQDHWQRPGWHDGATAYYWLLDLGDQPQLNELAETCQRRLTSHAGLDMVPLDLLHLTLLRVGSADMIRAGQIDALADAARIEISPLGPFRLTAGPLAGSPSAIRFTVSPWDSLDRLHQRLHALTTRTIGDEHASRKAFRPHAGIAYCNRTQATQDLIDDVNDLRMLPTAEIQVRNVDLVKLSRCGHTYRWELHSRTQLGHPTASPSTHAALAP